MEHVRVVARIRPEPAGSRDPLCLSATSAQCVDVVEPEELRSSKSPVPRSHRCEPEKKKSFTVDGVLGPRSRQDDVYEHVRPLALSVVDGYNATVFAYGHTGSGKTHTMTGTAQEPGVTPRAVRDVFGAIERAARRESAVFLVHVSYVELYNNVFRNLLEDRHDHAPSRGKIEIRESRDSGIFLGGPRNLKVPVKSERDVRDLVAFGDRQRQYASTNCNEHSSRSHCVLTLHAESRWAESRFRVREREFEALCNEKASSASENARLKRELQRLGEVHDDERAKLEAQLGKVIHGREAAVAGAAACKASFDAKLAADARVHEDALRALEDGREAADRASAEAEAPRRASERRRWALEDARKETARLRARLDDTEAKLRESLAVSEELAATHGACRGAPPVVGGARRQPARLAEADAEVADAAERAFERGRETALLEGGTASRHRGALRNWKPNSAADAAAIDRDREDAARGGARAARGGARRRARGRARAESAAFDAVGRGINDDGRSREAAERREALKASLESKFAVQIEAAVKLAEVEKDREREAALSAERRSLAKDREAQLQTLQRTFLAKIHEAPREPPRERPLALENGDDFGRERRDLEFAFSERLTLALLERDRCLAALGEKLAERDRDLAATRDDAEADAEARRRGAGAATRWRGSKPRALQRRSGAPRRPARRPSERLRRRRGRRGPRARRAAAAAAAAEETAAAPTARGRAAAVAREPRRAPRDVRAAHAEAPRRELGVGAPRGAEQRERATSDAWAPSSSSTYWQELLGAALAESDSKHAREGRSPPPRRRALRDVAR
ncbi:hypothetical protein JL721_8044 [Aureococcus anophagefferens]|nr:hypothetical protein JL721_8044 [Aureococcus anophagefferens]